jgi:hypothetical protein
MPAVLYTNSHTLWEKSAGTSICWVLSIAFVCFLIQSRSTAEQMPIAPSPQPFPSLRGEKKVRG